MTGPWEVAQKIGWIGFGGFLGVNARYWLGGWVSARWGSEFPWATFVINVTGAFVRGLLMTLLTERFAVRHPETLRLAVAVGFLGGYTTFSTFAYETLALASDGAWLLAFANALGSLVAGFVAVWLGVVLGRLL